MQQKLSALIGIIGGIIDVGAGLALLQNPSSMMPMDALVMTSSVLWAGYFLLALGALVLFTGVYMISASMMRHRSGFGWLMILYGVIMLVVGVGMMGQMFPMMQGSALSGSVMIVVGAAMLYSGSDMARK